MSLTIADEIENLRRFPQDAEVSLTLGIVTTRESYGGQSMFFIYDKLLPDWSKPDTAEEYRRIMEDDEVASDADRISEACCRYCGGPIPSPFNYCPQGEAGSQCEVGG